jgi:cysteine sulfinate desulfinase/cysteine desulfurase-like protein
MGVNMTDQELRIFGKMVKKAKREIAELHATKDERKLYFKIIRTLASYCVDDQGRVHWDYLEQALSEDGLVSIMTARNADGTRLQMKSLKNLFKRFHMN